MRKRRAIIYDDDLIILNVFRMFFELRGYDVITCREPVRCPIYDDLSLCDHLHPCGDVMLTDYIMPRMTGLELLLAQQQQGCKLPIQNKAIISGYLDDGALKAVARLGCTYFQKPVEFEQLERWLKDCEQRMDLSVPLGFRRREPRAGCCSEVVFRDEQRKEVLTGEVMNQSGSGICIKVAQPPERWQTVTLMTALPVSSQKLMVRWFEPSSDGSYIVGMSCY